MDKVTISLPALDDKNQYVLIENVPVLDETADEKFDEDFLKETVKRTNKRCEEGDLTLLTLGHTDDDLPETEQPPLVGFAKNMKVGEFNGKVTVLADLYVKRDQYEEVMTYPRRSAEIWHGDESGFIDIVSFLRRTPHCDLGIITLKKEGQKSIYIRDAHEDGDEMTDEQIDKLASRFASSLEDVLARFAKSKDDEDGMGEEKDEEAKCDKSDGDEDKECRTRKDKADEDDDKSENEEADDDDEKSEEDEVDGDGDEEKSENAASVPAGGNTFTPGEVDEKKAKKLRRDSALVRLALVEKELADVIAERDTLRLKLRRSERTYDLKQLEAEGYTFDIAEELSLVETLGEEDYARHMGRARKLYRRGLDKAPMVPISRSNANSGMSKDDIEKVLKFKKDNNIADYAVALNRYLKEVKQ